MLIKSVQGFQPLMSSKKTAVSLCVASLFVLGASGSSAAVTTVEQDVSGETGQQGGYLLVTGENSVQVLDGVTFSNNSASSVGGALSIVDVTDGAQIGNNVTFKANQSETQGGAIHNQRAQGTTIGNNAKFEENVAKGYGGGAIYQDTDGAKTSITIGTDAQFINNKTESSYGGAIMNYNAGEEAKIVIGSGATFRGNTAEKHGGAIASFAGLNEIGDKAVFENNSSKSNGGAVFVSDYGSKTDSTTIGDNATFSGNTAVYGGAISAVDTTNGPDIGDNAVFESNISDMQGGAIHNQRAQGTTIGNNAKFEKNVAKGYGGGAIYQDTDGAETSITIGTDAQFIGNKTETSHGGAIMNYSAGNKAKIEIGADALFKENSAAKNGGAVSNWAGEMTIASGASFEGNHADGDGGAVHNASYNDKSSNLSIKSATFANNSSNGKGGAIANDSELHLTGDNLFYGNTADGVANDISNSGNLYIADGKTSLGGGIMSTGTVDLTKATLALGGTSEIATLTGSEATLAVSTTDFVITDNQIKDLSVQASGQVNDALNGNIDALTAKISGEQGSLGPVVMAEGEVVGEVIDDGNGNRVEKVNQQNADVANMLSHLPTMFARIEMNDLRKRMGDLRSSEGASGVWARYDGGKMSGLGIDNKFNKIQIGVDTAPSSDSLRFGVALSYTNGDVDSHTSGADTDTYSLSGYGIWMGESGQFADVILRLAKFDTDLSTRTYQADLDQMGLSLSGEFGWRFALSDLTYLEPSVEGTYTWVDGDSFSSGSTDYELDSTDSFIGRLGVAAGLKCPNNKGDVYVRIGVAHEFMGDTDFSAQSMNTPQSRRVISTDGQDTWIEYAIGANFNITSNAYVFADIERTSGADIDEDWRANVGFRYAF